MAVSRRLTRMAAFMTALVLVYGCWQLLRWPGGDRTLIGDLFFIPLDTAGIYAAWAASRRCSRSPQLRSAWRLLALALAVNLIGDLAQTLYELAGSRSYPSVADGFYTLFYPLMLAGLLRFPTARPGLAARVRLALDLAVVAVGASAVVVYVVLGPTIVQGGDPLQTVISIAYPVGDMVLLVGLGSVLLRRTVASSEVPLAILASALLAYVTADLVYGYITLHSIYHGGDPVDSLYVVAMALFALAGAAQPAFDPATDAVGDRDPPRASWAPYVAVAVGFGLLLVDLRDDPLLPDGFLVIAAVLLATLVSIRQFLAQRDLLRTQGQLSYQSLHDQLTELPNRALIIDRADQLLARARRSRTPVAALYVDIDGFKHINDGFGHAAGDAATRCGHACRESCVRRTPSGGSVATSSWCCSTRSRSTSAPSSWPSASARFSRSPSSSKTLPDRRCQ